MRYLGGMLRFAPLLPLLLTACGYTPPSPAARAMPAYQADLSACQDSAPSAVNKQNAKTGLAWLASPIRRWGQIEDGISMCMADKGYGRVRWCTADELRGGTRTTDRVVTSAGIQCVDPAGPRRG